MKLSRILFLLAMLFGAGLLYAASPAAKVSSPSSGGESAEVVAALNNWAQAWAQRDLDGYLAAYSPQFTPRGLSREAWEKQRRQRVGQRKSIRLSLKDVNIRQIDENRAEVTFNQAYKSGKYRDRGTKVLALARVDGKWLIEAEQAQKHKSTRLPAKLRRAGKA
ncbi:hypothetical protein VX159_06975 [Dechloromonas sp. ZY10]|uniref:YybH family protein n=1 Tax=Dechloromonas aquae TaxID=2664436 RepID=UPI003528EF87